MARVQETRLALEALPIGQITIDQFGNILSIDDKTAKILGLKICSSSITSIFSLLKVGNALFTKALAQRNWGLIGDVVFFADNQQSVNAKLVCLPDIAPNKYSFNVIFSCMD